ncbi:hypothetical protein [Bradyrhizobium canariense]|uniref:hypothetical protein n=1 Tax=Bradyrhizobium canariense TaxID=255045 RepID=UPI0011778AF6|nr:hypothetical protein [Bradyrhizobium canariense]
MEKLSRWRCFSLAQIIAGLCCASSALADQTTSSSQAPNLASSPPSFPAPASTPPLSFDDPRFAGNTSEPYTRYGKFFGNGEVVEHRSWDYNNDGSSVVCGDCTLKYSRIRSNEGFRCIGSSGLGGINIDGVYIETKGLPGDHADGLQCYDPGKTNTITVRNATFKTYNNTNATAGFFYADGLGGSVSFENVLFWGGPYGLRMHPGGMDVTVSLKDVYFVGPFLYGALLINNAGGGTMMITKWENVRSATIVNGQLVPGNLIPPPRIQR